MLGGAVGDALGAPVEFNARSEILKRFGESGIRDFAMAYGRTGAITDDTQMALFCAEGMLRAHVRAVLRGIGPVYASVTSHAYLRWLLTQGTRHRLLDGPGQDGASGWLVQQPELFHKRAPGNTCIAALTSMPSYGAPARNDSKGCGAVMRVAPIGLLLAHASESKGFDERVFDRGVEDAALTHGHPSGQLPAGFLALLIALLAKGHGLAEAIARARAALSARASSAETLTLADRAVTLANAAPNDPSALAALGEGWVAEEALAIGLYCAVGASSFESAVVLAVNHDGDSDSTGAITGNILGTLLGESAIPRRWLAVLEARDIIERIAEDLATVPNGDFDADDGSERTRALLERYPPW